MPQAILKYEDKSYIALAATGSGGFTEFASNLREDECLWAFLRLTAGDVESRFQPPHTKQKRDSLTQFPNFA